MSRLSQESTDRYLKTALAALRSLPDASVLVFDQQLRYVLVAGRAVSQAGFAAEAMEGKKVADVLSPERSAFWEPSYRAALRGESTSLEVQGVDSPRWYRVDVGPWRDQDGAVAGGLAVARDITARRRAQNSLEEAEELLAVSFDNSPLGITLATPDGRPLRINRAFADMLGYSVEELLRCLEQTKLTHADDRGVDERNLRSLLEGQADIAQFEKRYIRADGHIVWALVSMSLVRHADGKPRHVIAQIEDISDRMQMNEHLRRLADHDCLTGLRNRRTFEEATAAQVDRCRRYRETAALLLIDVDCLKRINDTYGHNTGDDVLKVVAATLTQRLRDTDFAFRIGGDEFAVLLPYTSKEEATVVALEVQRGIAEGRIGAGAGSVHSSVSIGVATLDQHTADVMSALAQADRAMYAAKRSKDPVRRKPGLADLALTES
jgi:diguanylate cyclase (GGDEF)-like protein/PAS domain S-box-containing protein